MTTLKVNVVRKPTIKVKVLPNFPSSVTATSPILLSRVGGNYAFSFDATALETTLSGVYAPLLFTQSGTGAVAREVNNKLKDIISVKDFGAVGNGVADDTAAIQATITWAQTLGATVFFPPGTYKITSSLLISARLKIKGSGFQGDSGGGFLGSGVTQSTGFLGSVIVAGTTVSAFVCTTNKSVQFEDIQITYPSTPNASIAGITIQAVAGAGNANTQSFIQNCMITGADMGIVLTNCLDFRVNNNDILYSITYGIVVNSPNYPSYNQASISDNEIWGAGNAGFLAHILLQAGGDLRIINNKLQVGGVNTNGIALFGAASGSQSMEPIVIAGNSIEGTQNGICFGTANASFMVSQIVITGNQIWAGGNAIRVNTFGVAKWIASITITGNALQVNGGAGKTAMVLDNMTAATIVGNTFNLSGGGSTSTGIVLGANTANTTVQANAYDAGYTTQVSNLGTNNTVGVVLTGPITATNGATAIASQTGTGTKFVVDASPALTGTPTAPTAAVDTNTTQIATTAMVVAQAGAASPLVNGTATVGTSLRYSRQDHVHPIDLTNDARVTTQFDKTSNVTLSDITGLSLTLTAGLTYGFQVSLYTSSNSASGVKASIAGTATATAITFTGVYLASVGFSSYGRATALGGAIGGVTAVTDAEITINGTITVNAGGTLTAQFAQNVSGGTASSVLVGSTMKVWRIT